jgi:carbamate kinase
VRIVAALGGNALLKRGERPDSDIQEHNVEIAIAALAPLARDHELVITHGNGPQVGVLALESASDPSLSHPYPLDTLGAETQGLIGYWLVQELHNHLPDRLVTAIVTQTVVDRTDPAFDHPTKFVGPVYDEPELRSIAAERDWEIAPDGDRWRRVVASPQPVRIVETPVIRLLLDAGAVVVCAGGGGIPVGEGAGGQLTGVEAVIDKDLTSALLAEQLGADAFLVLTDVDGVYRDFGTSHAERIAAITAADLRGLAFPTGSMGPKIDAVCRFVEGTDGFAAIGSLADAETLLDGSRGTRVTRV